METNIDFLFVGETFKPRHIDPPVDWQPYYIGLLINESYKITEKDWAKKFQRAANSFAKRHDHNYKFVLRYSKGAYFVTKTAGTQAERAQRQQRVNLMLSTQRENIGAARTTH